MSLKSQQRLWCFRETEVPSPFSLCSPYPFTWSDVDRCLFYLLLFLFNRIILLLFNFSVSDVLRISLLSSSSLDTMNVSRLHLPNGVHIIILIKWIFRVCYSKLSYIVTMITFPFPNNYLISLDLSCPIHSPIHGILQYTRHVATEYLKCD